MEVTGNMSSPGLGNPARRSQERGSRGRRSSDSKKLQSFRRQASGVSSALWPAEVRRSLATGRAAQRQRSLAMSGKRRVLLRTTLGTGTSLALMIMSVLVGGIIVVALILRLEYLLLFPTAILAVITLLVTPPLLVKLLRTFRPVTLQPPPQQELRGLSFYPMRRRSPETPLPAAPLVRVLETVDLSQSDAEHSFATATTDET